MCTACIEYYGINIIVLIVFQSMSALVCQYTPICHVTEQIWMPYCKYDSHSHYNNLAYRPNIFAVPGASAKGVGTPSREGPYLPM